MKIKVEDLFEGADLEFSKYLIQVESLVGNLVVNPEIHKQQQQPLEITTKKRQLERGKVARARVAAMLAD